MQSVRKTVGALLAAGLALTLLDAGLASPVAAAHGGTLAPGVAGAKAGGYTVTLVTGDRVTMTSPHATTASVVRAKGREHARFMYSRHRGALSVIPLDALALLNSGKLDRRLFDVTGLIRLGYDDAHRDTVPLLVSYQAGVQPPRAGGMLGTSRVRRDLPAVNGAALAAPKTGAAWSALTAAPAAAAGTAAPRTGLAAGVARIWLDGKRRVLLDKSVPQIGAPAEWKAGFTGKGVSVAVLDTGVDASHPDLAGKVVAARNFTEATDADTVGHGTHVASTIAGTGAASGGKYRGVAPDATIVSAKVCGDESCADSALLAGMQWAAADQHAKVVNLSLGGPDTPDVDPLEKAVNTLTAQYGTLFVVAAGNGGPAAATLSSPGSADAALTVGAVDASDKMAGFSSRGPRTGDSAVKPDITAPGVGIVAARAKDTSMGTPVDDRYTAASGTSMATPHVAGAAALLVQQHPTWAADGYKAALMASAKPDPKVGAYLQGAGRVDVARAIGQTVTAGPASVSFGRQNWPHTDDQPVVKTVTYHNTGTVARSLSLTMNMVGPSGAAAPEGMFRLSAGQVTVPAGGQSSVTVTADTRTAGPDGAYSGQLLAAGDQVQVSTPLGVEKEVESYDLTVNFRDRDGKPTGNATAALGYAIENPMQYYLSSPSGTARLRLPRGRFILSAVMSSGSGAQTDTVLFSQPVVELTRDLTIDLDARAAGPVNLTVPRSDARVQQAILGYLHSFRTRPPAEVGLFLDSFDHVYSRGMGAPVPRGESMIAGVRASWARPDAQGGYDNSPYQYAVAHKASALPTGYVRHYQDRDLATVVTWHHATQPGQQAWADTQPTGFPLSMFVGPVRTGPLPSSFTRYVNTENGIGWTFGLSPAIPDSNGELPGQSQLSTLRSYRAGQQLTEHWNQAPFGPGWGVNDRTHPLATIAAVGPQILVDPPMFTDRAGHAGWSNYDKASATLYRNGKLLQRSDSTGTNALFDVPTGTATYRLDATATRSGHSGLSSTVTSSWTFRASITATGNTPLPVLAARFTPQLNEANQAPSGRYEIPVTLQAQQGAKVDKPQLRTVEVSYDDGAHWTRATVRPKGNGWIAVVNQPATGFVSLRATARDRAGNTLTQTIIHAYALTRHR